MKKISWLKSPVAVIIGLVAGGVTGVFFRQAVPYLKPMGDIYLSMLQMCVLPIMISAIVVSISGLLVSGNGRRFIVKIIVTFVASLILVSITCIAVSLLLPEIREPSEKIKVAIGTMISENGSHATGFKHISFYGSSLQKETVEGLSSFFVKIVPKNIFAALSDNDTLKVIFFFSVFGVLITMLERKTSNTIRAGFETIYKTFQKMISFMMYFLPFGLLAMTASQFSEINSSMISSMLLLVLLINGMCILNYIVSFAVICIKCGCGPIKQFRVMSETIFIALGTKNAFAAMPSAIAGLTGPLGLDSTKVNSVLPMGIAVCRFGSVMIFTLSSVFACGLYGVSINIYIALLLVIGSNFAGLASSGAPGIVARSMVAIVLNPLMVPSQAIIIMLVMIDPIIGPFSTLSTVYSNCAVLTVISKRDKKTIKPSTVKREEAHDDSIVISQAP